MLTWPFGPRPTVETLVCYKSVSLEASNCRVSCTGLYADASNKDEAFEDNRETGKQEEYRTPLERCKILVFFPLFSGRTDNQELSLLLDVYKNYKHNYAQNIKFDPNMDNLSKYNYLFVNASFYKILKVQPFLRFL